MTGKTDAALQDLAKRWQRGDRQNTFVYGAAAGDPALEDLADQFGGTIERATDYVKIAFVGTAPPSAAQLAAMNDMLAFTGDLNAAIGPDRSMALTFWPANLELQFLGEDVLDLMQEMNKTPPGALELPEHVQPTRPVFDHAKHDPSKSVQRGGRRGLRWRDKRR